MANKPDQNIIPSFHKDKDVFKSFIEYTTGLTGFRTGLVEKDYYLSLILLYFNNYDNNELIFKGGSCLNKVHLDFYRLSEDLDFTIPMEPKSTRNERRKSVTLFKEIFNRIVHYLNDITIEDKLIGYNNSKQYIGKLSYKSLITGQKSNIKIEVGLRENLIQKFYNGKASTLLQDPFKGVSIIPDITLKCLSLQEAFAEKIRAALTRKELAIRDYFDIYFAYIKKKIKFRESTFIKLVKKKLSLPGIKLIGKSIDKYKILFKQLDSQLKPVLKESDFDKFDLNKSILIVDGIYKKIK